MCELLGLNFKMDTTLSFSFRGFRKRGENNPHGWGLADYSGNAAHIFKEPRRAKSSRLSKFLRDYSYLTADIFIGHVRYASSGSSQAVYSDTHPFDREMNGQHYVFAHNGTLRDFESLGSLEVYKPLGETDSEYAFCYLLEQIKNQHLSRLEIGDFEWLREELRKINTLGKFNCLFSDGTHLFCYHDLDGYKGLNYVRREPPFSPVKLKDEDWEVDLSKVKEPEQCGFVIATDPITNEDWERFESGELIVFRRGGIVYRSSHEMNNIGGITERNLEILRILRTSEHRVRLEDIILQSDFSPDAIKDRVHFLLAENYIQQDSRDEVGWDNENATFYTSLQKREEIDDMLN